MKKLMVCLMAMMGTLALSAQKVYDFKVTDDAGKEVSLAQYKGKVLLIVNTATRCGFTPQYRAVPEVPGRGLGDSRLPLQPVWPTGSWHHSGNQAVLLCQLRHPVSTVR